MGLIILVIGISALLYSVYIRTSPQFSQEDLLSFKVVKFFKSFLGRFGKRTNAKKFYKNSELVKVLLGLEEKPLEALFKLYKEQFGQNAARYARHTYRKWKEGKVRPNKQTFNRLLIHLPNSHRSPAAVHALKSSSSSA